MLAHLADANALACGPDLRSTFAPWIDATIDPDDPPQLEGGVEIAWDRRIALRAGCCASVHETRQWWTLLGDEPYGPWNGHDPFSTAHLTPEGNIQLVPGEDLPAITIERAEFAAMLEHADRRLIASRERLLQFARTHSATGPLLDAMELRLGAAMGLLSVVEDD